MPNDRLLVIDTATEALSVALFDGDAIIGAVHEIAGRGHAEKLIPAIASLPEGGRATHILVNRGPGSFTGVRVGLAAARALAFAWDARLTAYQTPAMVAAIAHRDHAAPDPVMVAITGGHGELFWQRFAGADLHPLAPVASTQIDRLAREVADATVYGTGAEALVAARGHGVAVPLYPDARRAPLLPPGLVEDDARPTYGRAADARPMAAKTAP